MLAFIACEAALLRTGPLGYAMLQFRQHLSPTPRPARSCLAIVLAAGEGTRMRSALPKALHAIGGRTLLAHVLSSAIKAGGGEIAVVVGADHDAGGQAARAPPPKARHRACGAGGAQGDRARRRRHFGDVRRYAAGAAANADRIARGARARRGGGGAGFQAG